MEAVDIFNICLLNLRRGSSYGFQGVPLQQPEAEEGHQEAKDQDRGQANEHGICEPLEVLRVIPSVVKLHDGDECAGPEEHAVQSGADMVDPLVEMGLPSYVQIGQGQGHQAHDDRLDVQLARKDGHIEGHEGLGSQGPQLDRCMWGCHVTPAHGVGFEICQRHSVGDEGEHATGDEGHDAVRDVGHHQAFNFREVVQPEAQVHHFCAVVRLYFAFAFHEPVAIEGGGEHREAADVEQEHGGIEHQAQQHDRPDNRK
mmetsp:Transcript_25771/g.66352  ORF Transcript_25771/g.66352 Transcript_25771/m.66352 type:complete len:257 (-) Transcript_25771:549-1319(-)